MYSLTTHRNKGIVPVPSVVFDGFRFAEVDGQTKSLNVAQWAL